MSKSKVNRFLLLKQFAEQIKKSYGAISSNIQKVVEVLNSSEDIDESLRGHIEKIIASLEAVEKKILVEKGLANETENLRVLNEEINKIKELESYLKLARRSSSHSVIVAINNLNKSLLALFAK